MARAEWRTDSSGRFGTESRCSLDGPLQDPPVTRVLNLLIIFDLLHKAKEARMKSGSIAQLSDLGLHKRFGAIPFFRVRFFSLTGYKQLQLPLKFVFEISQNKANHFSFQKRFRKKFWNLFLSISHLIFANCVSPFPDESPLDSPRNISSVVCRLKPYKKIK